MEQWTDPDPGSGIRDKTSRIRNTDQYGTPVNAVKKSIKKRNISIQIKGKEIYKDQNIFEDVTGRRQMLLAIVSDGQLNSLYSVQPTKWSQAISDVPK
jgi:hypothetical protein